MGRDATKAAGNPWYQARKKAAEYDDRLCSRESAAEQLGMSVSSLADAELGNTKFMPVDKAVLMADRYNAPWLLNHYCLNECPIGCRHSLSDEVVGIDRVTVKLLKSLKTEKLGDVKDTLLDIAADGKITEDEKPALQEVLAYLDDLAKTVSELKTIGEMVLHEDGDAHGTKYGMFDPETGHQQLYDMMMDAPALLLCYQEKRAGEAVGHTIFARSGTRADLNSYITTNREEEAVALAKGKKIKRPQEGKLEPLKCSMLPLDYEITEDSDIRIIQIAGANAQYYRMLWTHNFVGSQATYNRAVLIDGYVAAVFGISKMAADSIFVWYVMKAPHKLYRLGRLCYMLAQNQSFVDTLLDDIDQEKVTKMRTAMLTKYTENKEVRSIMKLVNRQEDAKNGYKLTYEAALVAGRDEKATLAEWLRREKQWQQKRAQQ